MLQGSVVNDAFELTQQYNTCTYHTRPASLLVYLVAQKHKWKVLPVSRIGLQLISEVGPLRYHSSCALS